MVADRKLLEVAYAEKAAEALPLEDYARWQVCTVAHRVSVQRGSVLVLYKMHADGRPEPLQSFKLTEIDLSWNTGLQLSFLSSGLSQMDYHVKQSPDMLAHDIFCWTPFFPDVRYEPHPEGEGWLLRTALCIRMRSHPDHPVPGDTYLMPVGEFRGRFPQYASVRF